MSLYQPKSLLKLVLYGFGFASLPLILVLGYAALNVDRLAHQSQHAVYQAVQAITNSRQLIDLLTTMERTGRQYLVLQDDGLLEAFEDANEEFRATAQRLHRLPLDDSHRDKVDELTSAKQSIAERIRAGGPEADQVQVAADFLELNALAQDVLAGSSRMVDREVSVMQETAAGARTLLFWLALAVLPLTLISVGVFTTLISRPVRQLDRAIRRLGDGQFEQPVEVSGPEDLQYLGIRLNWLRQRLMDLEEQKGRFLRHMSHELKTPLTAIREGAELLQDHSVGELSAEQQEVADILRHNTVALQRLIEDLLSFSTARGDGPQLAAGHVRLRQVIGRVARNHKPTLMAREIRLVADVHDIHLIADADKLGTIVDNLLSNAIKFSPRGGKIIIRGRREGDQVMLEVTDQGPGIPPDEQAAVFDAFFQGKRQAQGYVKGSGLGLSIAKEYVEAHGGVISVDPRYRQGTRIRLRLPQEGEKS
ncbi:MAG: histidine kinase [Ectothiorhodospiraceae bacterium]|nr:histidine kinase [Ectothiorhodospiraceae bacterium]